MKKPKLKYNIIHSVVFIREHGKFDYNSDSKVLALSTSSYMYFWKKETMRIIKYGLKNTHENILSGLKRLFLDFVKFFRKGFAQLFKC